MKNYLPKELLSFKRKSIISVKIQPYDSSLPFELPTYSKHGDACMDIRSSIDYILKPNAAYAIPTNIRVKIPYGFEIQIRSRSGLALKNGVFVLNSPGTIDSGYIGEIKVILKNVSDKEFTIKTGDRIAQMLIAPVYEIEWQYTEDSFEETERGEGGFNSTGVK